jgi:hypothetical protein
VPIVAAVEHRAPRGPEAALEIEQGGPHARHGRDLARRLIRRRAAQVPARQVRRLQGQGGGGGGSRIGRVGARIEHAAPHGAVEQPGVEIG